MKSKFNQKKRISLTFYSEDVEMTVVGTAHTYTYMFLHTYTHSPEFDEGNLTITYRITC